MKSKSTATDFGPNFLGDQRVHARGYGALQSEVESLLGLQNSWGGGNKSRSKVTKGPGLSAEYRGIILPSYIGIIMGPI